MWTWLTGVGIHSLTILSAILIVKLIFPGQFGWRLIVAVMTTFTVFVNSVILILGSFGILTLPGLTVAISIIFILLLVFYHIQTGRRSKSELQHFFQNHGVISLSGPWLIVSVVLIIIVWSDYFINGCFNGIYFNFDDFAYHASAPARWLTEHRMELAPSSYQAYYPLNAELMSLWFMLPCRHDAYVSMCGLFWVTLAMITITGLVIENRSSLSTALLCSILFAISWPISNSTRSFSAADLAGAAAALTAIAWYADIERTTPSQQKSTALFCGLSAGLAMGAKAPYVLVVGILCLAFLFHGSSSRRLRSRIELLGLFVLAVIATGGYWYIRNAVLTGNPCFPAEMGPFDGPLNHQAKNNLCLSNYILAAPLDWVQWKTIISQLTSWPLRLCLFAGIGYLTILIKLIHKGFRKKSPVAFTDILLWATGFIMIIIFPFIPYSGSTNNPHIELCIHCRYLIYPFTVGLILCGRVLNRKNVITTGLHVLCVIIILMTIPWKNYSIIHMVIWILGGVVLWGVLRTKRLFRWTPVRTILFVPLVVGLIAAYVPVKMRKADNAYFKNCEQCNLTGYHLLQQLPPGSRIGSFGMNAFLNTRSYLAHREYLLYGRQFQFKPVHLNLNGSIYKPLHQTWSKRDSWWPSDMPDLSNLMKNILESPVDYIVVTKTSSQDWPQQESILALSPLAVPLFRDSMCVIYQIRRDQLNPSFNITHENISRFKDND